MNGWQEKIYSCHLLYYLQQIHISTQCVKQILDRDMQPVL